MGIVSRRPVGCAAKKLIEAARHWAGASPHEFQVDEGVVDALAAFGARQGDVDAARERGTKNDFEVLPPNWNAVQLFLALTTQWRCVGLGTMTRSQIVRTGIDYVAVEPVMRVMGIKRRRQREAFEQLQVMEHAALEVLHAELN